MIANALHRNHRRSHPGAAACGDPPGAHDPLESRTLPERFTGVGGDAPGNREKQCQPEREPGTSAAEGVAGTLRRSRANRSLVLATIALMTASLVGGCASKPEPMSPHIDRVVVRKAERRLELIKEGEVYRSYRIALGDNPRGHKMQEGDERTPEGEYILDWRNPRSNYYKSIHVSYPNARDRAFAEAIGIEPGGMIMIHGRPNWLTSPAVAREYDSRDWTDGCIAVTNPEMEEIWQLVRDGTPIQILP